MSLGHRIRQLRQARGLTQSQLGGPLSKSFISLLEKDRTQPSLNTLLLVARRLGTSVDALLGQSGNIPAAVCEGLLTLSRDAIGSRQYDEAQRYLDVVDFLSTKYALKEAVTEALLQGGQIALDQRAFDIAWGKFDTALQAARDAGDEWRAGRALLMMGRVKLRQRDLPTAASLLNKALDTLRRGRAGRDPARVQALIALGTTLTYMGDYAAGIGRYREAARSDVAQRDARLRGQAFWGLGLAQRKLGHLDQARQFLLEAKDAFDQAEELGDLMRVLHNLGQLLHEQDRSREALRYLHHALRVADRINTPVDRAAIHTEIGRISLSVGNLEDAEHFVQKALEEAAANDPIELAEAKTVLAEIRVRRSDVSGAIELMKDSVATFRGLKMRGKVAVIARDLGLLLRARGAHAQAAEYLALSLEYSDQETASRETTEVAD